MGLFVLGMLVAFIVIYGSRFLVKKTHRINSGSKEDVFDKIIDEINEDSVEPVVDNAYNENGERLSASAALSLANGVLDELIYLDRKKQIILSTLNAELADMDIQGERLARFSSWFSFYFRTPWDDSGRPKVNLSFLSDVKNLEVTSVYNKDCAADEFTVKLNVGYGFSVEFKINRNGRLWSFIVSDHNGPYDQSVLDIKGADIIQATVSALLRGVNIVYYNNAFKAFDELGINPVYLTDENNALFNVDAYYKLTNDISYDSHDRQYIVTHRDHNDAVYDYVLMDLNSASDGVRRSLLDGTLGVNEIYSHMVLSEALLRHAYRVGDIYQTENVRCLLTAMRYNLQFFWSKPPVTNKTVARY